jgi:type I restriction enzyme, S subunit
VMNSTNKIDNILFEQCEYTTLENEELFEYLNGLWKGKKAPYVNIKVLRNTNFNNDGTLSFEDVAELSVEEKQFKKRQLMAGDIILERSGGGPKQPVGRVVLFDLPEEDYSFSNFTTCIRVKDWKFLNPRFLLYYLLSFYNQGKTNELQQRTTGIRNLNFADYKKTLIPLPLIQEQELIVFILRKLRGSITQQERIIAKTKELKRSLMHRLFTYGLRGEELKETEIGLMPKSWDAKPFETLCENVKESWNPGQDLNGIYVGLEHIESGSSVIKSFGTAQNLRSSKFIFNAGDILYGKLRPYLDKAVIAHQQGICSTDILVFRPKNNVSAGFIVNMIHSQPFIEYAKKTTHGVNHPRTSWNSIKKFVCGIPPVDEQYEIAKVFLNMDKKIYSAEDRKQVLQDLFKSMLQLLMTGQVRVKDVDFGGIIYESR